MPSAKTLRAENKIITQRILTQSRTNERNTLQTGKAKADQKNKKQKIASRAYSKAKYNLQPEKKKAASGAYSKL